MRRNLTIEKQSFRLMDLDIPLTDFSVIGLFPAAFDTQLKPFDSEVPLPDILSVISRFRFSLVQEFPLRCATLRCAALRCAAHSILQFTRWMTDTATSEH
jgi:hypothetical protein